MLKVGVVGASGYGGMELLRILSQHPETDVVYVAGNHDGAMDIADELPFLGEALGLRIQKYDAKKCAQVCEMVFVALPSGTSGVVAAELWRSGCRVIDLSGDLRLPADVYAQWYDKPPVDDEAIEHAVYGLSEFHRAEIRAARLIANPGCFATAALLALQPALQASFHVAGAPLYIDAKSGVSGAGRSPALNRQLAELTDNVYAYRVGRHQHTPEIEQELARCTGATVLMSTQLLPIARGISTVCYVPVRDDVSAATVCEAYVARYAMEPFVRVLTDGQTPALKHVRGSNHTHISLYVDPRTRTLQVFAALDNLQKGAAGQAVQNLNIMMGWPETAGLTATALYP